MKKIAFLGLGLLLITSSGFAANEQTKVLECMPAIYGVQSILINESNTAPVGTLALVVKFVDGSSTVREISTQDFENLNQSRLYIASDNELNILLSKREAGYYLTLRGDGYNHSELINCK